MTERESGFAVTVGFPFAVFGSYPVSFEVTRNGNCLGVAAVLYHGERATIDFGGMEKAALVTYCEADSKGDTPVAVCVEENGRVSARLDNLGVSSVMKPTRNGDLQANIHLYRDDEEYKPAF